MLIKFIPNIQRKKRDLPNIKNGPCLEQPQLFVFISLKFPISRQSDEKKLCHKSFNGIELFFNFNVNNTV